MTVQLDHWFRDTLNKVSVTAVTIVIINDRCCYKRVQIYSAVYSAVISNRGLITTVTDI